MEAGNAAPALQVIVLVSSWELHFFLRCSFHLFYDSLSHPFSLSHALSSRFHLSFRVGWFPPVAIPKTKTKRFFPGLQPTTSLGAAATPNPIVQSCVSKTKQTPHTATKQGLHAWDFGQWRVPTAKQSSDESHAFGVRKGNPWSRFLCPSRAGLRTKPSEPRTMASECHENAIDERCLPSLV